jgi:hypothetical protein
VRKILGHGISAISSRRADRDRAARRPGPDCGGRNGTYAAGPIRSAELFDPSTGTFEPTGDLVAPLAQGYATLLADGRALLFGQDSSAEIYEPGTGTFSAAPDVPLNGEAVSLTDGRVVIAGGARFPSGADLQSRNAAHSRRSNAA